MGGILQRQRELRRRRKRAEKIARMKVKIPKMTHSEKAVCAEKLRRMSPGAEQLIVALGLEERK